MVWDIIIRVAMMVITRMIAIARVVVVVVVVAVAAAAAVAPMDFPA